MSLHPTPTPGTQAEPPIAQDWWPEIDLATLRKACKLDGTVTPERLRHAAVAAVHHVNDQLTTWQALQTAASLADVTAPAVDGQSRLVACYLRAIYSHVQAELTERYQDWDVTGKGQKQAADQTSKIDEYRRDLRWAITDLRGQRRTTVDLI